VSAASHVFAAALVTALATGLGAVPFLFVREPNRRWLGLAYAVAAGFMAGASAGLVLEGNASSPGRTIAGLVAGVAFMLVTRRLLTPHEGIHVSGLSGTDAVRAIVIVAVMTLHSFAEGVGVGVAFGDGETLGVLIAVAIAVHNIPEGLAVSLALVPRGASVASAAGWSIFSSLPQPLMAVPAFLFVESFSGLLPAGLGFAAGAMLWLVVADLVPEAVRNVRPVAAAAAGGAAAVGMLAFQLLLL
jgi:zinc transporter ZupT